MPNFDFDLMDEIITPSGSEFVMADDGSVYPKKIRVTNLPGGGGGGGADVTPPSIVSATVPDGAPNTIVVVFSESTVPTTAGYSFKKNGVAWPAVSVAGSGTTWTFTMTGSASSGDTILRSYNQIAGNTLDIAGNELNNFTDASVLNSVSGGGGGYDADAINFFDNAGITDGGIKTLVNTLIVDSKAAGIFSKMRGLWAYLGTSAAMQSYNMPNASFQITWSGAITRDAYGITCTVLGPGSATGRGDTGLNADSVLTNNNYSFGVYVHNDIENDNVWAIGASDDANDRYLILQCENTGNFRAVGGGIAQLISVTAGDSRGHLSYSRRSSTLAKLYKNGSPVATDASTNSAALPNANFNVMARGTAGGGATQNDIGRVHCCGYVFDGLTDAEMVAWDTILQAFMTGLGRNV